MTDGLEQTNVIHEFHEPATNGAPAGPVTPPGQQAPGGNYRWVIAGGVVALVVALTALAFTLLTGQAPRAAVLGYVPSDSIMYGEARLDLPGDQRTAVGQFLSKFPGFADQSIMESKIDETLDRIVGGATEGEANFTTDFKPWFGGQLAFSLGALPDPSSATTEAIPEDARFLALLSVKDEALARAWLDAMLAEGGNPVTHETYNGADLSLTGTGDQTPGAAAILGGKVLVLGDPASVRASVDTGGSSQFGANADVDAAFDAVSGDHVGFVYIALRPLVEWSMQTGVDAFGVGGGEFVSGLVPDWGAFALRVEGDGLVMEAFGPTPDVAPVSASRRSALLERVPGSTIALSINNDFGAGLKQTLETLKANPATAEVAAGIEEATQALGGTDAAIGWIGDFGVVVNRTDSGLDGGVLISPTDPTKASGLFTSLRTLASLGGSMFGITVRDEPYAGTTITIVDLGEAGDLAGQFGLPPEAIGPEVPIQGQRIELAYAIVDDVVVLGADPGFVRRVLDTTVEASLARNDRFEALLSRAGEGSSLSFLDITAVRALVEGFLTTASPEDAAMYQKEIKPFLEPFDALIGSSSVGSDLSRNKVIVTVK
jgi:hypothetical protein